MMPIVDRSRQSRLCGSRKLEQQEEHMGFVGVAPGTTTLTLPDGSTVALADWIDDKLYGTVQFTSGQNAPLEAFSNGRSQPIPGGQRVQTRVDTNIPRNGDSGLPKDWEMLVYGWGIKFVRCCRPASGQTQPQLADQADGTGGAISAPCTMRTAFNIDRVTFFQYEYNAKGYTSGVLQDYPTGHGLVVYSTNSSVESVNNGVPSPRDRVALVLPVHERENLGYKGLFQPEAPPLFSQNAPDQTTVPLSFVDIKLYKYGLIKRTVV
jgi:hypothetical protein